MDNRNPTDSSPAGSIPQVAFEHFSAWFGHTPALQDVNLEVHPHERLALIGYAGSGKTTLLRSLNRLHDLTPHFRKDGRILLDGQDLHGPGIDVVSLRRRIGLVSATAGPLPGSVFDSIALPLRMAGEQRLSRIQEQVELGLQRAFLWDDLKDRLQEPAFHLSPGKQRQLVLARALAFEPEIVLLDEPAAGLDYVALTLLEDVLDELKAKLTIVFATNDTKQAARASDRTAFFQKGELVEWGPTRQIFTHPANALTNNFITERF
jgi:phosphate transport system ATP-binding protein